MPLNVDEKLSRELEIAGLAAQTALLAERLVGTQPAAVLVATQISIVAGKLQDAAGRYLQDVAD